MSDPRTADELVALKAAADEIKEPHTWGGYEQARAEFWKLYAKTLESWADMLLLFDLNDLEVLTAARAIAAEVEART